MGKQQKKKEFENLYKIIDENTIKNMPWYKIIYANWAYSRGSKRFEKCKELNESYNNTSKAKFLRRAFLQMRYKRLKTKLEEGARKHNAFIDSSAVKERNDEIRQDKKNLSNRAIANDEFKKSHYGYKNTTTNFQDKKWLKRVADPTKNSSVYQIQHDGSTKCLTNLELILAQIQKNPMTVTTLPKDFLTKHPDLKIQIIDSWQQGLQNGNVKNFADPETGRPMSCDECRDTSDAYMRTIGRENRAEAEKRQKTQQRVKKAVANANMSW